MKEKTYQRIHSCSNHPSIPQIASYIIFLSQTLVFYIHIQFYFVNTTSQIVLTCLFSLTLALLIFSSFVTGQIDPSDQLVLAIKNNDLQTYISIDSRVIKYKQKNSQRILHCQNCQSYVKQKSRHCRTCDICIENFDHHCIWLNTCIGSQNYKMFFATILITFSNLIVYVVSVIVMTYERFQVSQNFREQITSGVIISWVVAIVSSVFVVLISGLIGLHIYLQYKEISTYQLITIRREQQRREKLRVQEEQRQMERLKTQELRKSQKNKNSSLWKRVTDQFSISTSQLQSKNQAIDGIQNARTNQKINISRQHNNKNALQICHQQEIRQAQQSVSSSLKTKPIEEDEQLAAKSFKINSSNEKASYTSQKQVESITSQFYYQQDFQKSSKQKKINKFFKKNRSLNFFLNKRSFDYDSPSINIKQAIQLDQKLQEYKRNKSAILTHLNKSSFSQSTKQMGLQHKNQISKSKSKNNNFKRKSKLQIQNSK